MKIFIASMKSLNLANFQLKYRFNIKSKLLQRRIPMNKAPADIALIDLNAFKIEKEVEIKGKQKTLKCIITFDDAEGKLWIELTYSIKNRTNEGKLALKLDESSDYLKDKDKLKEVAIKYFNKYMESMLWDFEELELEYEEIESDDIESEDEEE